MIDVIDIDLGEAFLDITIGEVRLIILMSIAYFR